MAKRMKCPREGTKVVFQPNPASRMMYSGGYGLPNPGETGTVTTVPLPGGRKTCMSGPGGGLVYVRWDGGSTVGVSSYDIAKASKADKGGLGAVKRTRCPRGCVPVSYLVRCEGKREVCENNLYAPVNGLGATGPTHVCAYPLCTKGIRGNKEYCAEHEGSGADDEPYELDEDDITTGDHHRWYQSGKLYFTGDEAGLRAKMDADRFWPNVFFVDDHGGTTLLVV